MRKVFLGVSCAILLGVTAILGVICGINSKNNSNLGDLENNETVIFNDLQENGIRLRQNKITQNGSGATITAEITPAGAIKPTLEWEFSTASGKKWKTEADDLIQGMDSYPTISASINLECVGRDVTAKTLDPIVVPDTYSLDTMTMKDLLALYPEKWYNEKTTGGTIQGNAVVEKTPEYVEYMTYSWTEQDAVTYEEVYVYDCQQATWSDIKDMTIKQFVQTYIQTTECPNLDTYEEALKYFIGEKAPSNAFNSTINLDFVFEVHAEYNGSEYYDDFYCNPYTYLRANFDFSNLLNIQSINLGASSLIF